MAETTLISVRVPKEIAERLQALAKSTRRSKSFLAANAIEDFVAHQEWFVGAVEKGLKDIEEGRFVTDDKVDEWLESWGTDDEKDMPEC